MLRTSLIEFYPYQLKAPQMGWAPMQCI